MDLIKIIGNYKIRRTVSVGVILIFGMVIFLISRFRPYIGDDVLMSFSGGITLYTSPEHFSEITLGYKYNSVLQMLELLNAYYNNWGGRVLYCLINPFFVVTGKTAVAIFTVFVMYGTVILGLRLVYGNIKEILSHPICLLISSALLLIFFLEAKTYYMREMINVYGLSIFLYIALANMYADIVVQEYNTKRSLLFINLIGFLAGITHEMVGAWFIIQFFYKIIVRKRYVKDIKCFFGLMVGYCICFFAPGNFLRMCSEHEKRMFTIKWVERVISCARMHFDALFVYNEIGGTLFWGLNIIALFSSVFLLQRKKYVILKWYAEIVAYIVISILLWSVVQFAVFRGIYGSMLYYILLLVKVIYEAEKEYIKDNSCAVKVCYGVLYNLICLVACVVIIGYTCDWIPTMVKESMAREKAIMIAAEEQIEAHVRPYSDRCKHDIMYLECVDSQKEYDNIYYKKYYGTHIVLDITG